MDLEGQILELLFEDSSDGFASSFEETSSSSSEEDSESSDSEDQILLKERKCHVKLQNFVENLVARYDKIDFQEHFRMERDTVDYLIGKISVAQVLPTHNFGRKPITAKKAILLTIWYLANAETFRQISDRFNVSKSSAYVLIEKITKYFVLHSGEYIIWPSGETLNIIEEEFFTKANIRGVVGASDGSHIKIKRPSEDQEVFYNRKGYHSVVVQAVCDSKKRFTDIFCGEAGSQHDGRVFRKSNIYRRAEEEGLFIGNFFLLGDSAYPLLNWVIPPFKDRGNLTANQLIFNRKHSSTRISIEHSFGLLKSRFRRLLYGFENSNINFIVSCIICACIFHNICINFDDLNIEIIDVPDLEVNNIENNVIPDNVQGIDRRNLLFQEMFGDP